MPYRLSSLAERDLDEIWSYVAENASPATASQPLIVVEAWRSVENALLSSC